MPTAKIREEALPLDRCSALFAKFLDSDDRVHVHFHVHRDRRDKSDSERRHHRRRHHRGSHRPPRRRHRSSSRSRSPVGRRLKKRRRRASTRSPSTTTRPRMPEAPKKAPVKRRICTYWSRGKCRRDKLCTFAHGDSELGSEVPVLPLGVKFREQCKDWACGRCNLDLNCPWLHDQSPRFLDSRDTDDQTAHSDSDDKSMEDRLRRFLVLANGNEVEGEASPTRSRPRPPRSRSGLWPRGSVAREIQPPPSPRSEAVREVQHPPSPRSVSPATLSAMVLDGDV